MMSIDTECDKVFSSIRLSLMLACLLGILLGVRLTSASWFSPQGRAATELLTLLREYRYAQLHMGMKVQITVWSESQSVAETACKKAFRRIAELESVFSDYDPASEVSRLTVNAVEQPIAVSDELWEVLIFCKRLHELSDGAFDPTIAPVISLWRMARRQGELPLAKDIESARARTGFQHLILDENNQTVRCRIADMKLDFGGVAKGYIGDQVILILKQHGIESACYEAGGDFVLSDAPPNAAGWEINVAVGDEVGIKDGERLSERKILTLANCGVAVSGDTVQFVEIDGQRYSHVVDPRTGIGLTTRQMAWVTAPSGMESDALATTGTIISANDFQTLLKQFPNVHGWSKDVR